VDGTDGSRAVSKAGTARGGRSSYRKELLTQEEALEAGLLWCTQTEAAAVCHARNVAERRKRGQRLVSLQASSPLVDWAAAVESAAAAAERPVTAM
jgi:hypothetical protein